jgi:GNAT superfamily N-acetyltransferase
VSYLETDTLPDGRAIRVRAVTPADRDALRAGFARLAPDSVWFRFLSARSLLTDAELDFLAAPDFRRHIALGAELREGDGWHPVGVARCLRDDAHAPEAEFAIAVDEAHRREGIGTLLLCHLVHAARTAGIERLVGLVHPANHDMLEVLAHLEALTGCRVRQRRQDDVARVVIELTSAQ